MRLNFLVVYDKISIALFYFVHNPGGDNMTERKNAIYKEKTFSAPLISASRLPIELTNLGIKLKEQLKSNHHEEDAATIDHLLCHYDYLSIDDKIELLHSLLDTSFIYRLSEIHIPALFHTDWINLISGFERVLSDLREQLERETQFFPFYQFRFCNKEFEVMRDAFQWVIQPNCIVLLLKENDKYFDDNLVSLDYSGNTLWSSLDSIPCKDRRGACFVGLAESDTENKIIAYAYMGVNYTINAVTGNVYESRIVK